MSYDARQLRARETCVLAVEIWLTAEKDGRPLQPSKAHHTVRLLIAPRQTEGESCLWVSLNDLDGYQRQRWAGWS